MAIKSLLHYALEVPDQTSGDKFYQSFGLSPTAGAGDAAAFRPRSLGRECVVLYPGPRKRLHHLAFGAPGDAIEAVREALRRDDVTEVDPPRGVPVGGLWIRDPDGNLVNIRDEALASPPPDDAPAVNAPGRAARQGIRGCPDRAIEARPRRLGHVLLFTPNLDALTDFYTGTLGMKLSDRSGSTIAFLRCSTDHHNLALLASRGPGFHHGSFEVGSIDEIAMGAARMQEAGWQPGWGLGRHVIGSNYFFYMRDPWGSFVEYYYDLDCIPDGSAWEARDFAPEDALYRWGPAPPADFGLNREVE